MTRPLTGTQQAVLGYLRAGWTLAIYRPRPTAAERVRFVAPTLDDPAAPLVDQATIRSLVQRGLLTRAGATLTLTEAGRDALGLAA